MASAALQPKSTVPSFAAEAVRGGALVVVGQRAADVAAAVALDAGKRGEVAKSAGESASAGPHQVLESVRDRRFGAPCST